MLTLKVTAFHIPARVAGFGGSQNASVREGDLAVRAAADAEVVAKAPVVEIMLTLEAWLRYETSAYAKPGFQCQHNLNYWRFGDYLGIGCGAHGKITFPGR